MQRLQVRRKVVKTEVSRPDAAALLNMVSSTDSVLSIIGRHWKDLAK